MKQRVLLDDVNEKAKNTPHEFILGEEKNYHDKIRLLADLLCSAEHDGKRIVFLAGPSGSGKTTTANLLSDALTLRGRSSAVVSLDMFYRGRESFPKKPDGSYDYENITAIDCGRVRECLSDILCGKTYRLHRYDFANQRKTDAFSELSVPSRGLVIVEGIHGLNPILCEGLPAECIFKLFVSVSNGYSFDGVTEIVTGKDLRFARRLSRDFIFRGASADKTAQMWTGVLEGENTFLYPYKELADMKINTFHAFEAGILKPYVARALEGCTLSLAHENAQVRRIMDFFGRVENVPCGLLPQDSLIREFIGNGIYDKIH